jgi:GH25 family lysozyme M1 (1,4-beta-N-acetylmuramidase)
LSLITDLEAAHQTWLREQAEADAAKSAYDALLLQRVADGPDISQFQGVVDFTVLKAGFLFQRVADGDIRDTSYTPARVSAIRASGIPFSPYYFARVASPGNQERNGRVEAGMAVHFATSFGWGKPGDLPLAYDFETLNGQEAPKAAKHLIQFVKTYEWIMQHKPIIYTNPATAAQIGPHLFVPEQELLASCPLWVAHWGVTAPTVPVPWTSWTFHQFTATGSTAGVSGNVDLNHFSGSQTELQALRIQ